jgi:hypothetical protein
VSVSITEIVVSYARPRMLFECLTSVAIAEPDEVIVCDDGSVGFDVVELADRVLGSIPHVVLCNPPIAVDDRMRVPRQGALINRALGMATGDVASLICDDDLRSSGWYDTLRAHWTIAPRTALVRGKWLLFHDGATPGLADPESPMCQARKMTAGNFAWRADLTRGERPRCRWPTDRLNCLDDGFLWSLQQARVDTFDAPSVGFAGWRRSHPFVNNDFSDGKNHTPAFRAVLERGFLEP